MTTLLAFLLAANVAVLLFNLHQSSRNVKNAKLNLLMARRNALFAKINRALHLGNFDAAQRLHDELDKLPMPLPAARTERPESTPGNPVTTKDQ